MILKTDQLLKFSQFCKDNELFFSSDRLSDLIIFLKKNELDNQDTEINFLYHLLPTNKLEKERLRDLINEFFGYLISTGQEEFLYLDEYKIDSMTDGQININFKNVSDDLRIAEPINDWCIVKNKKRQQKNVQVKDQNKNKTRIKGQESSIK